MLAAHRFSKRGSDPQPDGGTAQCDPEGTVSYSSGGFFPPSWPECGQSTFPGGRESPADVGEQDLQGPHQREHDPVHAYPAALYIQVGCLILFILPTEVMCFVAVPGRATGV